MNEVRFINVPAFGEIGVKYMYDKALKLPHFNLYMPDRIPKSKMIDRSYFYNCFNTLYPEEVAELIKHANEKRYSTENDRVAENSIIMTEEWAAKLDELPYISKQKGRMAHLLKQKSKIISERKERVTYDAFDFLKRPRVNSSTENMA